MKTFANLLIFIMVFTAPFSSIAANTCADIRKQVKLPHISANVESLKALYEQAQQSLDCDNQFRGALGRYVAKAITRDVQTQMGDAEVPGRASVVRLENSLYYGRVWQALAMIADHYFDAKQYAQATVRYQQVLEAMDDEVATSTAPDPRIIEHIFRRAEHSRLLSPTYVKTTLTRSGNPTGLAAVGVRGFSIERVAIPVTFKFDSTEFTGKGKQAVDDMIRYLGAQKQPDIHLIGHTDPVGDEEYNIGLSENRAFAVKEYLIQNGYQGRVSTEGKGENRPPVLDDPKRYTEQERHQLARRVELERKTPE